MVQAIKIANDSKIYVDIDLDFWAEDKSTHFGVDCTVLDSEAEINLIINKENELFKHINSNIMGFSIAFEPFHCGSYNNSIDLYSIIRKLLFHKF